RRRLFSPAAEVDRGERFAASVQAQGELEVALADDAPVDDLEHAVEQGLREALPPGAAVAEGFGMGPVELGRRERTVAVDGGLQRGGIEGGGGVRLEGGFELLQARGVKAQAGGHGVAAEAFDEAGV